jgi:putative zinc finger/helix-turn-helix YgiT family protein
MSFPSRKNRGRMICTVCGIGTTKKVEKKHQARYNGEPVEVAGVQVCHCDHCGEDSLTPEQARAYSRAVKNEVRKRHGLLPPERILAIRKKAGLTQKELEELLSQGPKVVTRWESGRVIQGRSADTVLRLLEREPALVRTLREIQAQRSRQRQHYTSHGGANRRPAGGQ